MDIAQIEKAPYYYDNLSKEISKIVVGQSDTIKLLFISLLCRGHVLLVGVPGLAKTTLVNCFSQALDLSFNRVQFTPDLMPSDIIGTEILQENKSTGVRELVFHKGPIFTHILLGDEINRTPPKTQSALLQAMQEQTVTVFGRTQKLDEPFMVMATQNPIEQEGTYPLPEAQMDRFLFSIDVNYPNLEEEVQIIKKHTSRVLDKIKPVITKNEIMELQKAVLDMTVSDHIYEFVASLVRSTRPSSKNSNKIVNNYVQWGAGPRAANYLLLAAKAKALLDGRPTPTESDVKNLLYPTLNHRIILNFQAEAENINSINIINEINIA
jgi:MoxR-like ATPase